MVIKKLCFFCFCILLSGCFFSSKQSSFIHDIKSSISEKNIESSIVDLDRTIKDVKIKKTSTINLKSISLSDFITLIFSEVLEIPYLLDRDIDGLEKVLDIEIKNRNKNNNLFAVVVALLESYEIDVQDVDGVLLITKKVKKLENDNTRENKKVNYPADCIYTYQPRYVRAIDLQPMIQRLLLNESSIVITSNQVNKLVIRSTEKERRSIIKLLRDLDMTQKQILIDVTLAEISLTGDMSIGLQGFLKTSMLELNFNKVIDNGFGITGAVISSDMIKVVLQQGEKNGIIKIKSNPYILVADSSDSVIEIGSEYPILKSQQTTDSTSVITNVDYRKTGIILNIKPVVSGNTIHLSAVIEMSEGQKNVISSINSPAILSRKIKFDSILESGKSLIVGGLVSETSDDSNFSFIKVLPLGSSLVTSRTEIILIVNCIIDNSSINLYDLLAEKYEKHKLKVK